MRTVLDGVLTLVSGSMFGAAAYVWRLGKGE